MSATISVLRVSGGDPMSFDVTVREANGETRHRVTLSQDDLARLAGEANAEAMIEASFRFLLDREPKEMILPRFDVSVISRYFPDFEKTLPAYF
ncbi:hypothetical protein [Methylocystis sp. ATCC 49242]|uniref:hypothetical protein n=1 Tax=Methylocystis sp. ATCC 49242 TaxID=622637 RepID=UPI0001F888A9|nr:hypothetical protein [Methylocystis sp. ATCC 49242]